MTVFPAPTFLSAKLADVLAKFTTSLEISPELVNVTSAVALRSYILDVATAEGVMVFAVISPTVPL